MPPINDLAPMSPGINTQTVGESVKADIVDRKSDNNAFTIKGGANSVARDAFKKFSVTHTLQAPLPMSVNDMMLQLSNLSATLQGESVKLTEGMIEHNKDMIEKKSEERAKMFEKLHKMQRKLEKQQKSAEILGWVGVGASVLITAASVGSLSGLAAACLIGSTTIGFGNQVATSAGLYDALGKANPDAAKGVNYTMMALQIVLSLGGFAAASKSASTLADEGMEAGLQAGKASANSSQAAKMAGETAEAAGKTGSSMSGASSSQQMADDLVDGMSNISRSIKNGQQAADDVVDGASKSSNAVSKLDEEALIDAADGFQGHLSRVGHAMEATVGVKKTADGIEQSILKSNSINTNAKLQSIRKTITMQHSFMSEFVSTLAKMIEQMDSSYTAASEAQSKFNNARMTAAANISANTSGAV